MLRVGFVTCVQLGLSCMEAIYAAGGHLDFAMTLHDDLARAKSGRIFLDAFAGVHGIPLIKIRHINDADAIEAVRAAQLDWLFVVGWSQIAKSDLLSVPKLGLLGMHPTLLPVGRGRAPIPWAILLGLPETGVTLFRMDAGTDTGPILAQQRISIGARETATELYRKVNQAHAELLKSQWQKLASGTVGVIAQDESRATLWPGRKPEDGELRADQKADYAERLVRAVTHPYPGAFYPTEEYILRVWSSGLPNEDLGGESSPAVVKRLHFRDGWIDSREWSAEPRR